MLSVMLMKNLVKSERRKSICGCSFYATAEDLPDASFAGQQDTYLNVRGADVIIEKVKNVTHLLSQTVPHITV